MALVKETRYGSKMLRLIHVKRLESLSHFVLPIFPIMPLQDPCIDYLVPQDELIDLYTAALEIACPQLIRDVQSVCGTAPWIVRSAGNEDLEDHVNAGGYESVVCHNTHLVFRCVAKVALSGLAPHARRQFLLRGHQDCAEPIPCFVQPLLNTDVVDDVARDHTPFLPSMVLDQLESLCDELMAEFDFDAVDCEWGISTSLGFVSMTTIMPRIREGMNVSHAIGFGFSSAQNTGNLATSLVVRPSSSSLRLWRGAHLRELNVQQIHLLQVRPAQVEAAFCNRQILTESSRNALLEHFDSQSADLLLLGRQCAGALLVAPTLMSAWRRYLSLSDREQDDVGIVIVDGGTAEEHAGIMFRQQKITCLVMNIQHVPVGAYYAVFDRGTCIFGDFMLLQHVRSECRQELVLPGDCALVVNRTAYLSKDAAMQAWRDALLQLRRLPVSQEVYNRLVELSVQPSPVRWIQYADGGIESPSLLSAIWRASDYSNDIEPLALTEYSRNYERATLISQGLLEWPSSECLAPLIDALVLAGGKDFRIIMALLDLQRAVSWVPLQTLRRLLDIAEVKLQECRREQAVLVLQSVGFVKAECAQLPVYSIEDAVFYLDSIATDLEAGLPVEAMQNVRSLALPIASIVLMARQTRLNFDALLPVDEFRQAVGMFKSVAVGGRETRQLAVEINDAFFSFRDALHLAELDHVAEQFKAALIETYDASLKALLGQTIKDGGRYSYANYILLMQSWTEFLSKEPLSPREVTVFKQFQVWLSQWANEPIPASFEIQDRNWRAEFDAVTAMGAASLRYENPHVIHNLLHQYALSQIRLDASLLPMRVQSLVSFCATFSSRATKVLRFERDLLEIQIPMGTHKASYAFTSRHISVEWTEPPDCPGSEIARILTFEVFLARYRDWFFPGLSSRRECVMGTWTLFIRYNAPAACSMTFKDFEDFLVATRFLFDASYDFSYVKNELVEPIITRFMGAEWKTIITSLIQHRAVINDASQYVALHAQPMSSAVAALASTRLTRALLLRCSRRGYDYCRAIVDIYSHSLTETDEDCQRWSKRYALLRQACLFLAANWKCAALSDLMGRAVLNLGDDLIAACLFKRSDLADRLRTVAESAPIGLSGIYGMVVRHAPEIAVAALGPSALAEQLIAAGNQYRRAKHFLVARFADRLGEDVLAVLIAGLGAIPKGHTLEIESCIQNHVAKLHSPVCRFALEEGIDWVALESLSIPKRLNLPLCSAPRPPD